MPDAAQQGFRGALELFSGVQAIGTNTALNDLRLADAMQDFSLKTQAAPFDAAIKIGRAEEIGLRLSQARMDLQDYETLRPARLRLAQDMLQLQSLQTLHDYERVDYGLREQRRTLDRARGLTQGFDKALDAPTWMEMAPGMSPVDEAPSSGIPAQVTRFGYKDDPYLDSNSAKGTGNRANQMTPGTSVALKMSTARKMGLIQEVDGRPKAAGKVEVTFPDGRREILDVDSTIPESSGDNDRIDFYDPNGERIDIDGAQVTLRPVGAGADEGPSDGLLGGGSSLSPKAQQFFDTLDANGVSSITQLQEISPEAAHQAGRILTEIMDEPAAREELESRGMIQSNIAPLRGALYGLDPEQRAQFEREIETIQTLHPTEQQFAMQGMMSRIESIQKQNERANTTNGLLQFKEIPATLYNDLTASQDTVLYARDVLEGLRSLPTDQQVGRLQSLQNSISNFAASVGLYRLSADELRSIGAGAQLQSLINEQLRIQSGAAVSDQEAARFARAIGDPGVDSPQVLIRKVEQFLQQAEARHARALGNAQASFPRGRFDFSVGESPQATPAAASIPTITTREEMEALPSGTRYIGPDGPSTKP